MAQVLRDSVGVAIYTGNLAETALDLKDWVRAEALAREALPQVEKLGRLQLVAANNRRLAQSLVRQGKHTDALPFASLAVEILSRFDSPDLDEARATLAECED